MRKITNKERKQMIKTRKIIEGIIGRCYDENGLVYEDKRTYVRNLLLAHSELTKSISTGWYDPEKPLEPTVDGIHELSRSLITVFKNRKIGN